MSEERAKKILDDLSKEREARVKDAVTIEDTEEETTAPEEPVYLDGDVLPIKSFQMGKPEEPREHVAVPTDDDPAFTKGAVCVDIFKESKKKK